MRKRRYDAANVPAADIRRATAYDARVTGTPVSPAADAATPIMGVSTRRRRLPSPAEQARRVAWGKKYGAIMKELRAQWPK